MDRYKKKKSFQSKLNVDTLFNKVPMNLKCTLSQNERDFLEAVIHLQHLVILHMVVVSDIVMVCLHRQLRMDTR